MPFKSLMLIFLLYFSCGLEVDKLDPDLLPLSCTNGAINPPACDTCPAGKTMVGTECVDDCTNGAINPPNCDQCQAPKTWDGEKCVSPTKCTPAGTKIKWDTYSDSSILGFKVYLGIDDKNYSVVKSVMPWSATEALLAGLDITLNPCLANYIYVTAYKSTIESDPSNKVCWGEACD